MTAEPEFDPRRILTVLNDAQVDYIVVGGVAAQAHGAQRATKDLDCLPDGASDNLDRLGSALRELNARLRVEGLTDEESKGLPLRLDAATLQRIGIINLMTDAGQLDVIFDMPDRDGRRQTYANLAHRSELRTAAGATIRIASLDDIVASKEWANRPKDIEALPELRTIQQRRRAQGPAGTKSLET